MLSMCTCAEKLTIEECSLGGGLIIPSALGTELGWLSYNSCDVWHRMLLTEILKRVG
jgi:hypothetical protein